MMLTVIGCSYRNAPVAVREHLAFHAAALGPALDDLNTRYGCEAVVVSTCNRVELYLDRPEEAAPLPDAGLIAEFLSEYHRVPAEEIARHLYEHRAGEAVRHLFRVAASLDSLIVGEGQIAGQVKRAYELATERATVGPLLHALFQHAHHVAKRVRTDTGIARGHVSVSSAAVDYVRQVFDRFDDKRILVIGAGKMGGLTLRHLRDLKPRHILVTNRSPEKAQAVAAGCGGEAVPWEALDDALAKADIVLSTTGAAEPIVTLERYRPIAARRKGGTLVVLDIAVPRDFDARIHDGDRTCLFNIDDLNRIRAQTLRARQKHLAPAEDIVARETQKFLKEWARRRHGPVIARLTQEVEGKRQAIVRQLFDRLDGRLTEADRAEIEGAFRLFQSKLLHGPISALAEEPHEAAGHTLLEALRKLFRLPE
jgi:glutamyl-tRNA reductase